MLDAYEEALPNLRQHATGYPDADALRRVTKAGVDGYGMIAAAEHLDNEGVRHVISVLERADPRPVWFCVWGDGATLVGLSPRVFTFQWVADYLQSKKKSLPLFSA